MRPARKQLTKIQKVYNVVPLIVTFGHGQLLHAVTKVFFHAHMGKQPRVLKNVSEMPFLRRQINPIGCIEDRDTGYPDHARVRSCKTRKRIDQSSLTGAGGAKKCNESAVELKANIEFKVAIGFSHGDIQDVSRGPHLKAP